MSTDGGVSLALIKSTSFCVIFKGFGRDALFARESSVYQQSVLRPVDYRINAVEVALIGKPLP